MKIVCEVRAIETVGDFLRVTLRGNPVVAAEWRGIGDHSIEVPNIVQNQRTFHVGRTVTLNIKP